MLIVGYTAWQLVRARWGSGYKVTMLFAFVLSAVLIAQSSISNLVGGFMEFRRDAAQYRDYVSAMQQLHTLVPLGSVVLANPDGEANTLRPYGDVASWVSAKDGNISLFDGDAARAWYARYKESQAAFATHDGAAIRSYALSHGLQYYAFNMSDLSVHQDVITKATLMRVGVYGLAKF